jgi:transcriptional regulator with XRE-family HTH domain
MIDEPSPPWGAVNDSLERLRELLTALETLQEDLVPERFPPGKEATLAEMNQRLRRATKEVGVALRFAESELRQIALSDPSSPLALDLLRHLLRRARGTVFELEQAWSELDQILTDYVIQRELQKPLPETDFWQSQWGPDAELAKEVLPELFVGRQERLNQRDSLILRLKYERGYTQQQIADLLNIGQSTVALRQGRIEDEMVRLIAPKKAAQLASGEGFQVEMTPRAHWVDFVAERDDERIAVDVRPCSEDGTPRTRTPRPMTNDLESLIRVHRSKDRLLAEHHANQLVAGLYFRRDGAVAFYRFEDLINALQESDDLCIDSLKRNDRQAAWSLAEFTKGGGIKKRLKQEV